MDEIDFKQWAKGYGVIKHTAETQQRVKEMHAYFHEHQIQGDGLSFYTLLTAADRIANAAMWLVVHQAYAKHIYLDGRELSSDDFKESPQGHLGGTLNMIPGYVGYMLINALTGFTRSWLMGQGHCVAAIDSVNLLLNNMLPEHAERYSLTDIGLSRFAQDFYSYRLNASGNQDSPLGSHINPHTAGGFLEGGYLGFASVQYVHAPLPGEKLVAFLSDGAFEEQRGADWTPIWWREEDCGLVAPIIIANGRRIDQRATVRQEGCIEWFKHHLQLYDFAPIVFDGRDPAAFAWTIWQQELQLIANAKSEECQKSNLTRIPYGIADAPKGAGFYNEGTSYAHNLPLVDNPHNNRQALERFNQYASKMFVSFAELTQASNMFQQHTASNRKRESEHPLANRDVHLSKTPEIPYQLYSVNATTPESKSYSSMDAIDLCFINTVKANPLLRPRVGNPDELRSNRMINTLKTLKFRVLQPESGNSDESRLGNIITALNEEAIAGAAFGNKGGINIIVSYEAFATKLLGEARQEIIFSKNQKKAGKPAKWLSVPIILTSNTWENGKNELSHQDPTFCEAMLAETSDISRVVFPADYNSAAAVMNAVYQTKGQLWSVVTAKQPTPLIFTQTDAEKLVKHGAARLLSKEYDATNAKISLVAIGTYQLLEILKVSERLKDKKIPHTLSYILEPGRFRKPRNSGEKTHEAAATILESIAPNTSKHLFIATHTRPEIIVGSLGPIYHNQQIESFGFINEGGTFNVDGMLYVNHCSWAHILQTIASSLAMNENQLLSTLELDALHGRCSPDGIITTL